MPSLALYQPDIPQNVGAAMRLCAGLGVPLAIIEPCAFPWDEKKIRHAAMDYMTKVNMTRYSSWEVFCDSHASQRIILMSTKSAIPYTDFTFQGGDILLAGSESAGVPPHVHDSACARLLIPLQEGLRSLNVVNASSMMLGEALRQTRWSAP